jgi:hypothetical protein
LGEIMVGKALRRIAAGCLCAFVIIGHPPAKAAPLDGADVTLEEAVVELPVGKSSGTARLILRADNLNTEGLDRNKKLTVPVDKGTPDVPGQKVTFEASEIEPRDKGRRWLITANVFGAPPSTSQDRFVQFVLGEGQPVVLGYKLSNRAQVSFDWKVFPPPAELSVRPGNPIKIAVSIGEVPATQVRLLNASLIEDTTKLPLGNGFLRLCEQDQGACSGEPIASLHAKAPHTLWLRTKDNDRIIGRYTGSFVLAAAEKPGGDTFNVTIHGTGSEERFLGVVLIAVGVMAAWFVNAWVRGQLNRAQSLRPAVALRDRLTALKESLASLGPPYATEVEAQISEVSQKLLDAQLDASGYLPPRYPMPWATEPPNAAGYKTYLETRSAEVAALDILVEGLKAAHGVESAARPDLNEAVEQINHLARLTLPPTDLRSKVQEIVLDLTRKTEAAPANAALRGRAAPQVIRPETFEELTVRVERLSNVAWGYMLALTVAVGSYALVLSNKAFGLPLDYLLCLFWGFGLPTGAQLLTATPGIVSQTFGVAVPK